MRCIPVSDVNRESVCIIDAHDAVADSSGILSEDPEEYQAETLEMS